MAESRIKNAKRNIIYELLNALLQNLLMFLTRTVLIYSLGKMYLGLSSLFSSVLQVLSLAELGFGSAIIYSMYKPIAEGDEKSVNALLNFYRRIYHTIGISITVVGLAIMPFLRSLIKGDVPTDVNIYVLYIITLTNTSLSYFLFGYKESLLRANQRSDIISKIRIRMNSLGCILQIVTLMLFHNYYVYCIITLVMTVCQNLFAQIATRKLFPQYKSVGKVPQEERTKIKKNVFGVFTYKVSNVFRNSFDSIVLSAYLGLGPLAAYNNYYYILNSITNFITTITNSLVAGIGNKLILDSKKENHADLNRFQLIYMWIASWVTVFLYCIYQPFMKLWVGGEWMFSHSTMIIFCIYFFAKMMNLICYSYRQAAGLWWEDRFRPIIEAISNLTLNIFMVQIWGVVGVLLSTIVTMIPFNTVWGSRILYKKYFTEEKHSAYLLRLCYYAFMAFIGCVATDWICSLLPFTNGSTVLVTRAVICIVFPNIIFIPMLSRLPEFKSALTFAKKLIYQK